MSLSKKSSTNNQHLKIGHAAKALGVSIDTLRRWEKAGKIKAEKTAGGTRFYTLSELHRIKPDAVKNYSVQKQTTEELLKTIEPDLASSGDALRAWEESPDPSPDFQRGQDNKVGLFKKSLVIKALLGTAVSVLTLVVISWIAASLLTHPKETEPASMRGEPPAITHLGGKAVLAITSAPKFLEINTDTQINGSLSVRDSINNLIIEASPAASTFTLTSGQTTFTVSKDAKLNQDVSSTSSPTFSTLKLASTKDQLVFQSGGPTGTLSWTPTATRTITLPDATTTLVGTDTTQTLTNKSMSGSSNTFTSIPNSALSNHAVTVTAGTNLTGGGTVELGSSITISAKDSPSFSGQLLISDGTASAPGLAFTNDTNTGLYRIGADNLALITGGTSTQGISIDSSGNVGVGTITPTTRLHVVGTANITSNTTIGGTLGVTGATTLSSTLNVSGNSTFGTNTFFVNTTTGNVGVGTTSLAAPLHVWGNGTNSALFLNGNVGIGNTAIVNGLSVSSNASIGYGNGIAAPSSGLAVSGNVGIGTTSPSTTLDVTGTGRFSSTLTASNGLTLSTGALSLTSTSGSANLGLSSSTQAFRLGGGFVYDSTNNRVGVGSTAAPSSTLAVNGGANIGSGYYSSAAPANGLAVQGNVGIGTTSPAQALHVVGTSQFNGNIVPGTDVTYDLGSAAVRWNNLFVYTITATNVAGTVTGGSTSSSDWLINSTNTSDSANSTLSFKRGSATNAVLQWYGNNNTFDFNSGIRVGYNNGSASTIESTTGLVLSGFGNDITTGTNEHLAIIPNGTGNVGIGTSSPISVLTVQGKGTSTNLNLLTTGATGAQGLAVLDNGNVGIGTTSPSNPLSIKPSSNVAQFRLEQDNSTDAWTLFVNDGGGIFQIARVGTGANTAVTILQNGNLGIGSSNAGAKLHVNGNTVIGYGEGIAAPSSGLAVSGNVGIGITTANSNLSVSGNAHIGGIRQGISAPSNGLFVDGNVGIGATTSNNLLDVWGNTRITGNLTTDGTLSINGSSTLSSLTLTGNNAALSFTGTTPSLTSGGNSFSLFAGGNVGIGISSPLSGALTIQGKGTSSGITLQTYGSNLTQGLSVLDNGSVGIGTTSPLSQFANTGPTNIVDAGGTGVTASSSIVWAANASGYTEALYNASTNGDAMGLLVKIAGTSGQRAFSVDTGSSQGIAGTSRLVVLGNGNVGIGTTSPSQTFQVNTNVSNPVVITSGGNVGIGVTTAGSQLVVNLGSPADVTATTAQILQFKSNLAASYHGVTGRTETNTFGFFREANAAGGLYLEGIVTQGTALPALEVHGGATGDTTKTGSGRGIFEFDSYLSQPGGGGTTTTNANIFAIRRNSVTRDIFDDQGNLYIFPSTFPATQLPTLISGNGVSYFTGGNVGIGNTNPSAGLTVSTAGLFGWGANTSPVAPSSGLAVSGNVGVGTTSPVGALHVVGQCVTGDTKLRRRRRKGKGSRGKGEDDEWEEVAIKDIQPGDEILTLDEVSGEFIPSKVKALMDMGIQRTYLLITESGKQIRTTGNHPYLVDLTRKAEITIGGTYQIDQSPAIETLTQDSFIAIANKHKQYIGKLSKQDKKKLKQYYQKINRSKYFGIDVFAKSVAIVIEQSGIRNAKVQIDKEYSGYEERIAEIIQRYIGDIEIEFVSVGHTKNSYAHTACYGAFLGKQKVDIKIDRGTLLGVGQSVVTQKDKSLKTGNTRGQLLLLYPQRLILSTQMAWKKVYELKPGQKIATASGWETIVVLKEFSREQVYDIEVENTHNFVGNDIVAHNTYINGSTGLGAAFSGTTTPTNGLAVSGNVGIGTTTANSNLSVAGNAHIGGIRQGIGAPTNGLFVDGNVGIGATTSNNLLDVWGNARITGNLTVDGSQTFTGSPTFSGQILASDGTASAPGYSFSADTDTGIYRIGANNLGFATNGIRQLDINSTGTLTLTNSAKWDATNSKITLGNAGASYIQTASGSITFQDSSTANGNGLFNLQNGNSTLLWQMRGDGSISHSPVANTSGNPLPHYILTGAAHTGLTASTEAIDVNYNLARTVQFATGALTTQRAFVIQAPTYGFVGASTLTNATTLAVTGAPSGGTNATLTNSSALRISAGAVANTTNAYGLYVDAPTGATNNYAATFATGNVGIGTSSPVTLLNVMSSLTNGESNTPVADFNGPFIRIGDFGSLKSFTNSVLGIKFYDEGTSHGSLRYISNASASRFDFCDSSSTIHLSCASTVPFSIGVGTGNIGIGTTSPTSQLQINSGAAGLFFTSAGNLGIGATTSSNKLDVWGNTRITGTLTLDSNLTLSGGQFLANNGTSSLPAYSFTNSTSTGMYSPSSNALALQTNGASTPPLTITAGGNVGIGITNPVGTLQVNGAVGIGYGSIPTSSLPASGLAVSGNVGIGTTSPQSKLYVSGGRIRAGDISSESTTGWAGKSVEIGYDAGANDWGTIIAYDRTAASYKRFSIDGATLILNYNSSGNVGIGLTTANSQLSISNNVHIGGIRQGISAPTNGLFVDGNVGIGATTSSNLLDVWGNGRVTGTLTVDGALTTGSTTMPSLTLSGNNAALSFTGTTPSLTSGANSFSLFAGGNVGIGTSANLLGALTVRGTGTGTGITLQTYGSNLTQGLSVLDNGNVGIGTTSPVGGFQVGANSTSSLFVSAVNSGNVGIGNTIPGAALEITGNLLFSKETARTISVADTTTANTAGAALSITGAAGLGSGAGGAINITGGANNTGAGNGGAVTITGGSKSGTSAGTGGAVSLIGGSGTNNGINGGNANITAGNGDSNGGGVGGNVIITAGNNYQNTGGGAISLTASNGLGNNTIGSAITLTTGTAAGSGNAAGGALNLTTGAGLGSGNGGAIVLSTGVAGATGANGLILFRNGGVGLSGFDASGNLGIGFTAPVQRFQVNASTSTPFVVTSGGNVGIGFTTPDRSLQVASTITSPTISVAGILGANGSQLDITGSTASTLVQKLAIGLDTTNNFGYLQAGTLGANTAYNLALEPAGGNVGIGTTSPGAVLTVQSTNSSAFAVGGTGNTNPAFQVDASSTGTGIKIAATGAGSNVVLSVLSPNASEGLTIQPKNGGGLSVGTASSGAFSFTSPTSFAITGAVANALAVGANGLTNPVLQVDASTVSVATGLKLTGAAAGNGMALAAISSGTNEALKIDAKGSGNLLLQTSATGNVGIGWSNPAYTLHVNGSGLFANGNEAGRQGKGLAISVNNNNSQNSFQIDTNSYVTNSLAFTPSTSTSGFPSFTTPAMLIMASGNVGINVGSVAPSQQFQVNANASNPVVITSGGNVGIGVTGAGSQLVIDIGSPADVTASTARALQFKSNLAASYHGVTGRIETNTFGFFGEANAAGGLYMEGIVTQGTATPALEVHGGATGDTTKTGSGRGIFEFDSYLSVPAGGSSTTANANIFAIRRNSVTRDIFDDEGRLYMFPSTFPATNVGSLISGNGSSYLMGGNVGIGTSSPSQLFQVNANTSNPFVVTSGGNVGIGITTANSTLSVAGNAHIGSIRQGISAPTNGLFVDGNVGIGATTSSNLLDVWGNARVTGTLTVDGALTTGATTMPSLTLSGNNAALSFTGTTPSLTSGANSFSLFAGGNVGIGTSANLLGALTVRGAGTGTGITLQTYGSNLTPGLTALDNGNVGIGTTGPAASLDLQTSSNQKLASFLYTADSGYTSTAVVIDSNQNASSAYNLLQIRTDANNNGEGTSTKFIVQGDGNVGIGTATPSTRFQVNTGGNGVYITSGGSIGVGTASPSFSFDNTGQTMTRNGTYLAFGTGNVGIGTTSPTALLQVQGNVGIGYTGNAAITFPALGMAVAGSVGIGTTSTDGNAKLTVVNNFGALPSSSLTVIAVGSSDGTTTGSAIRGKGTISGGQADVGEYIPFEGDRADYTQGDLLASSNFSKETVIKSSSVYQNNLLGIVTTTAGLIAGGGDETITFDEKGQPLNRVIIALAGRVPLKVSTENGPIKIGDYLTSSSTPGVAMKALRPGQVVGKALEAFPPDKGVGLESPEIKTMGKILVFVNVSYADPGNFLASLSMDADGNLIMPKIKVGKLALEPSLATASAVLRASETSVAILTDKQYTDPGPQIATNSNMSIDLSGKLASLEDTLKSQQAKIQGLEEKLAALQAQKASPYEATASATTLAEASSSATPSATIADLHLTPPDILLASSSATLADTLKVGSVPTDVLSFKVSEATISGMLASYDAQISNNFKVFGNTTLGKTSVAGNLNIDGTLNIENGSEINVIGKLYLQKSQLADGLDIFNGKVSLDKNGTLYAKTVVADQFKLNQGKSAGVGKILAGQTEVTIENESVEPDSVILITPNTPLAQTLGVTNRQAKTETANAKFQVKLVHPESSDIEFNYLIIGINKLSQTNSGGT